MDTELTLAGVIAGLVAQGIQFAAVQSGLINRYKALIAVGASLVAGAVTVAVGTGFGGDTSAQAIFGALGAALGASQAFYALILRKLPA